MCISPVVYKLSRRRAFTLPEIVVVMIITGILATIAITNWRAPLEREYEANARATLDAVLRAEQNLYAWKGAFTSKWTTLEIDDPNNTDTAYSYALENVTPGTLSIRATRKNQGRGLIMNQDGVITKF